MPNVVRNVVKVKGLSELKGIFYQPKSRTIDFNTIIPEPKTPNDCHEKYILGDDKKCREGIGLQEQDGKPWFNWYDWHMDNWGCKWNVMDGSRPDPDTVIFETANTCPYPIIAKISKIAGDEILVLETTDLDGDMYRTYRMEWVNGYNTKAEVIVTDPDTGEETVKELEVHAGYAMP